MNIDRKIKSTLTPCELDCGDTLRLTLDDGSLWQMQLLETSAEVAVRGAVGYKDSAHYPGDILVYAMTAVVEINGQRYQLRREVGNQNSFYEPWVIDDVRIWFDAAACAFIHPPREGGVIYEKDWRHSQICSPMRAARFAVQQADKAIAPEPIGQWYENQPPVPDINDCYLGQDCWMGPYLGGSAHCGLDINMPKGTKLSAPISLDDQYMFNDYRSGNSCGRWRGIRHWDKGTADQSDWTINSHHIDRILIDERQPISAGTVYASAAGTAVGAVEHTHFLFRVTEQGGEYLLDPWILLWAAARGM